jgi:hypothetical protein
MFYVTLTLALLSLMSYAFYLTAKTEKTEFRALVGMVLFGLSLIVVLIFWGLRFLIF